ncbi:sperm acrosome membrane-associated protein 4-like [Sinocyclocheilus rhinocerous]|uniref:sperm acrosome membrane-associated protein 4-like n=1 Tax=Sinocyclocheilus rhinocerous TaxID=307959 RepID=UPI0007B96F1B|nr:PREDICTED: sperm acrosome membrane-associated protein 4-like [Sinocyclocheilus rhinocerous]
MEFMVLCKADLRWIPGLVLLVLCLRPPAVLCENLYCYYCPQTSFNRSCRHVLSECRPQELCFTARGRFGHAPVLFSKGCMSQRDCVRSSSQMIRGNNISFTYSCCGRPYCNSSRRFDHSLALLTVSAVAASVMTARWTRAGLS